MSDSKSAKKRVNQVSFRIAVLPSIILYVAAVVLIVLTRNGMQGTLPYWETFVLVVALISLFSGFGQAYLRDQSYFFYMLKQIIHWGVVIGLLWLLNTQGIRDALGDQKYLLMLVYLLGLGSLLAGLHMDWKLVFFGAFVSLGAYLLAAPENVAILGTIGDTFGIANAGEMPQTMIIGLAVVAFLASTMILIGVRGAVLSKKVSAA